MDRIGLLAGAGRLPVEVALSARKEGYEVCAVGLLEQTDPELRECVDAYADISVAKMGSILKFLKKNNVKKVTMIGKVTKELLFTRRLIPDFRLMQMLFKLPNRKDDTIMMGFVQELAKEGIEVLDQTELIRGLMPEAGVITRRKPTEEEQKDMEFGMQMARELGRLDVGQTVVVKDMAVMALEAIEGTDACITRGGELARGGAIVAKVAKPQQDNRFDVPAVGVQTLETMIKVGAKGLVIEAGRTLLVERDAVVALAEAHGITIVAMN